MIHTLSALTPARRVSAVRRGFTLVEILIVVIILGILAAIVIPQFTSASEDARKNSVSSQLQTIRSQVELYKLQHRDQFPTDTGLPGGVWDWSKLTSKTNADGSSSPSGLFGPYLQAIPVNGLNGKSQMATVVGGAEVGFVIDRNGKIFATFKDVTQFYNEATGEGTNADGVGFTAHGS